jgi:PAS domain S-box-containing protein
VSGEAGWHSLFSAAFRRSKNPMVLVDEERVQVDVNRAYVRLLHRRRSDLIGRPLWEFVHGGPLISNEEFRELLRQDEFIGDAELDLPDGDTVRVHWAAHPEAITGRRLILFVALSTYRSGRHFRREIDHEQEPAPLSGRELEIVRLVAMGETGPEIAEQLHISHNTVRTHIHNAMVKTGARSRAHLVAKALGAGLALT